MHPKGYSVKELEPNGTSCFPMKINPSLDMHISGEQNSGFGHSPNLDGFVGIKEILLDFSGGNNDQLKVRGF